MSKMKFVIVGCGRISHLHTAGYKGNPDAMLWGVCDINHDTAEKFAQQHGIPKVYGRYDEVLADPGTHVVVIATRHDEHARLAGGFSGALRALGHGPRCYWSTRPGSK